MLKRSPLLFTIPLIAALILAGCAGETPTPEAAEPASIPAEEMPTAELPEPTAEPPTPTEAPTDMPVEEPTEAVDEEAIPTPTARESGAASDGEANADVTFVRAVEGSDGTWTFHVTVEHPDTGWEDYADGWDIVTPGGEVLNPDPSTAFTRLLLHPHENEQPFTRSQSGIAIPEGATEVTVRAHDLVDGWGGREVTVDLTQASGPDYEVERAE